MLKPDVWSLVAAGSVAIFAGMVIAVLTGYAVLAVMRRQNARVAIMLRELETRHGPVIAELETLLPRVTAATAAADEIRARVADLQSRTKRLFETPAPAREPTEVAALEAEVRALSRELAQFGADVADQEAIAARNQPQFRAAQEELRRVQEAHASARHLFRIVELIGNVSLRSGAPRRAQP